MYPLIPGINAGVSHLLTRLLIRELIPSINIFWAKARTFLCTLIPGINAGVSHLLTPTFKSGIKQHNALLA